LSTLVSNEFDLEPSDSKRLASLCGPFDDNIKQIERRLGVEITYRNNAFKVLGEPQQIKSASELLKLLYIETQPIKGRIPELEAKLEQAAEKLRSVGYYERYFKEYDVEPMYKLRNKFYRRLQDGRC